MIKLRSKNPLKNIKKKIPSFYKPKGKGAISNSDGIVSLRNRRTLNVPKVSEKQIETAILTYLNLLPQCRAWKNQSTGVWDPEKQVFRKPTNKFLINGVSDIIGVLNGRPLFIEVKTQSTKKRLTKEQDQFLRDMEGLRAIAFVATSVEEVINHLKSANMLQ